MKDGGTGRLGTLTTPKISYISSLGLGVESGRTQQIPLALERQVVQQYKVVQTITLKFHEVRVVLLVLRMLIMVPRDIL